MIVVQLGRDYQGENRDRDPTNRILAQSYVYFGPEALRL